MTIINIMVRQFVACSGSLQSTKIVTVLSITLVTMKNSFKALFALSATLLTATAVADNSSRPDSHAPISIMGDHTHSEGEWMFSYRFMTMSMADNYVGSDTVSQQDVLQNFMVAPETMDMDMHMLGAMYAPSDDVTLMLMANYLSTSMDHATRMGMNFTTETSGVSDTKVGALLNINKGHNSASHMNLGLSIPTGSVKEQDQTPMGYTRLPYPMQLGSGTYDIEIGATHTEFFSESSWGIQGKQLFRTGYNDLDYRLGNRFNLNSWYAHTLNPNVSLSAAVSYTNQRDIKGQDSALNPMMVPTARTDLRSGYFWDIGLGANFKINGHHRLAVELKKTVHQNLDGPQLGMDWSATLGWQYAF